MAAGNREGSLHHHLLLMMMMMMMNIVHKPQASVVLLSSSLRAVATVITKLAGIGSCRKPRQSFWKQVLHKPTLIPTGLITHYAYGLFSKKYLPLVVIDCIMARNISGYQNGVLILGTPCILPNNLDITHISSGQVLGARTFRVDLDPDLLPL